MNDGSLQILQTEYNRFFGSGADGLPVFKINGLSDSLGERLTQIFNPPKPKPAFDQQSVIMIGVALLLVYILTK